MHVFEGELRVFYGISAKHRNVSFDKIFAPGGLLVSGKIDDNGDITVEVFARRDAELKLKVRQSKQFAKAMKAGETVKLILTGGELIPA